MDKQREIGVFREAEPDSFRFLCSEVLQRFQLIIDSSVLTVQIFLAKMN